MKYYEGCLAEKNNYLQVPVLQQNETLGSKYFISYILIQGITVFLLGDCLYMQASDNYVYMFVYKTYCRDKG